MNAVSYDDRSSVSTVPRKSVGDHFQALGQRLQRALSHDREPGASDADAQERSRSRGRRGRDLVCPHNFFFIPVLVPYIVPLRNLLDVVVLATSAPPLT
jgi:hypothetical protein